MKKILIANRGEIAVRIIRACHDMGIKAVAVYSQADTEALHVLNADEAICIGEPASQKSYLKIANILSACEITGADAVHPGFGFLSENANFASICESCGINFIGPSHQAISLLGDKAAAKAIAKSVKCPVIPGSEGIVENVQEGLKIAEKLGFPIFIKATAGGGGKGIRIANDPDEFIRQFAAARTEAELAFGNPEVYLEKMIVNPRHIEIQVIGDKHGNYAYLGERDCTIQRRRQKLIEETPSPVLSPALRKKICEAAVDIVKAAKYYSAGTVEFLLDAKKNFYFMEVNTRIQVEHTITEEATGIDLVREQIRIAMGEKLSFKQKDIVPQGHIIQCRINAEDPAKNFSPSPGVLEYFCAPGGPHVRIDTACYSGYRIPPNYDSMIAKLIVKGKDRAEAIRVAQRALKEFHIGGVKTTIPFHQYMFEDDNFLNSTYTITYIDQLMAEGYSFVPEN
ncbi:MAG: acetyl-CoA carboxylase biotin carboxylase subunit [Verrucomicrobia bacterium]|nr:acetyl-CoA carboxylase biotin carboxylase subunit [Verrucomicrobiota bacterium]